MSGLEPLTAALGRKRSVVAALYVATMLGVAVGTTLFGISNLPELVHVPLGDVEQTLRPRVDWASLGWALCFGALQLFLILGLGHIRARPGPGKRGRVASVLVMGLLTVLLAVLVPIAFYLCCDIVDRWDPADSARPHVSEWWKAVSFLIFTAASWGVWVVMAIVVTRREGRLVAIRRLVIALLAGSWLEFIVALGVDVGRRNNSSSCVCWMPSYFALMLLGPMTLFAAGPAIWLLYRAERTRSEAQPGRLRRILSAKTHWMRRRAS